MRRLALLAVAIIFGLLLTGCGDDDPFAAYCDEVQAQQQPLTEALATEGPTALINAVPSFRKLSERAPADIADEWSVLIEAIDGLVAALDDAGVDPATYDREQPPAGVTDEERAAIDAAARRLTAPETATALEAVQQQARDVCKTPLSL